jgi:hypothetical protein
MGEATAERIDVQVGHDGKGGVGVEDAPFPYHAKNQKRINL